MTTDHAKRWVQRHFRHFEDCAADELSAVVEQLCGCFDRLPASLHEGYPRASTYHDLWLEIVTDQIIEPEENPRAWLPELYPIYIRDQAARGGEPPSKAGFRQWLAAMVGNADADEAMQPWTPDMGQ
jgi:hypothetical protein